MSDDEEPRFGQCREDLRQRCTKDSSMFSVDDGILFLNIGIVQMETQTGYFMKPVRFCPFCGVELQSADKLAAWSKSR
jgi:hypothetical protein